MGLRARVAGTVVVLLMLGSFTTAGAVADYSSEVLADSPLGYWRLGESVGSVASDSSGNGRNGTYVGSGLGAAGAIDGDSDTAAAFDGNDYVNLPTYAGLEPALVSAEAWVQTSSNSVGVILRSRSYGYGVQVDGSGIPGFFAFPSPDAILVALGTTPVNDGAWHHLVGTFDGSVARIYADGALAGSSGSTPGDVFYITSGNAIGRDGSCDCFYVNGSLDEVALYGTALSASRVLAHYQAGLGFSNEAPTDITLSNAQVAENSPGGSVVGTLSATDTVGDTQSFTLVAGAGDGDNAFFAIAGDSLQLAPAASPDYETQASYSVRVRATDSGGLSTDEAFTITVTNVAEWAFSGFRQPVDNLPTLNLVKAGSAIPVKFSLEGNKGMNIFAAGYPKSEVIPCDSAALVDGIEQTILSGSSVLSYDAATDTYSYVWKTEKAWSGCRQLVIKFIDANTQRANFKLKS
jgi:hypothetical protein